MHGFVYLVFAEEYWKYTCNKYKKLKILVLVVVVCFQKYFIIAVTT